MVRLEWADIEAFDGKAGPPLRSEDLAVGGRPDMRLRLQPYVQLLDLRYPVDDLLLKVRDDEDTDFASNAFNEHRKRKQVSAVAQLRPSPIFLAVHRLDFSVYFRRLDREQFGILSALREGKSLYRAIEFALRKSSISSDARPSMVQEWFSNWAALGWFCRCGSEMGIEGRFLR